MTVADSRMKAALALLLSLPYALAPGEAAAQGSQMKVMREIAGGLTVESADGKIQHRRSAEPIYRYGDPARSFYDGAIWSFGDRGRPVALYTLAIEKIPGEVHWLHEFTALTASPIRATNPEALDSWEWHPSGPPPRMEPLPGSPAPGETEANRLRQMKALARRFSASEFWTPIGQTIEGRFELRLLPQPIHRYADPASGLVDGAIFLLAYGQNPEIALLIEARREAKGPPSWSYGLGRLSGARLVVQLDGRQVADLPKPEKIDADTPYGVAVRPVTELENPLP